MTCNFRSSQEIRLTILPMTLGLLSRTLIFFFIRLSCRVVWSSSWNFRFTIRDLNYISNSAHGDVYFPTLKRQDWRSTSQVEDRVPREELTSWATTELSTCLQHPPESFPWGGGGLQSPGGFSCGVGALWFVEELSSSKKKVSFLTTKGLSLLSNN